MKKITTTFFVIILLFSSCNNEEFYERSDVLNLIEQIAGKEDVNIYMSKKPLPSNSEINLPYETVVSPEYESWFVFIDDHPFANWSHPCRYVFINPKNFRYEVVDMGFSPSCIDDLVIIREMEYDKDGKLFDFSSLVHAKSRAAEMHSADNKWAVILSGGISKEQNYERYYNDCRAIFMTLRHIYNYHSNQVTVIMSNGTSNLPDRKLINGKYDSSPQDFDNDGINDIKYSATKSNLNKVFNELARKLTPEDELFIFVTDHGTQINGTAYICLWDNELLSPLEFSQMLSGITAKTNIVMEQCYSGGFINAMNRNNRTIATACSASQLSWATNDLKYNEFVYHWTAAVTGMNVSDEPVNADTNNDGVISMEEAFQYARNNDRQIETPQYLSNPITFGKEAYLGNMYGGNYFYQLKVYSNCYDTSNFFIPDGYEIMLNIPQAGISGIYPIDERQNIVFSGYIPRTTVENGMEFNLYFAYPIYGNLSSKYWILRPEIVGPIPYFHENTPEYAIDNRYKIKARYNRILAHVGLSFHIPDPRN